MLVALVHTGLNPGRLVEGSRLGPELPRPSAIALLFLQQGHRAKSVREIEGRR